MNEGQGLQKLKRIVLTLERQNKKHAERVEELDKKGDEHLSIHENWGGKGIMMESLARIEE